MSDVIPQCWECKYYPCKWFSEKERLEFCTTLKDCQYYEDADFAENLHKEINEILED